MALILKANTEYLANSGAVSTTAYLRCNPFERNDKDNREQKFYVFIYFSNDKTKEPLFITQVLVAGDEYDQWFSPDALAADKNLHDRAYNYLLERALDIENNPGFSWLQGDIWISDEAP